MGRRLVARISLAVLDHRQCSAEPLVVGNDGLIDALGAVVENTIGQFQPFPLHPQTTIDHLESVDVFS